MHLRILSFIAVGIALATPALTSEPGQPLDCSDWVFERPGMSCTVVIADCDNAAPTERTWCVGNPTQASSVGSVLQLRAADLPYTNCNPPNLVPITPRERVEIVERDGATERPIGYVDSRCGGPGKADIASPVTNPGVVTFDPIRGRLYLVIQTRCVSDLSTECSYSTDWTSSVVMVDGFTTVFEILQSYEPTSGPLSFRVPYMPEGLQYADYFDTYYGDLATVGDWSQARPLQCGYPATPPSVGDYVTVDDTLPDPAPGTGRYYVTAVTHQGQRRYGRQASGGVLMGRDSGVLPNCE